MAFRASPQPHAGGWIPGDAIPRRVTMSKGLDSKKSEKKKPKLTMKEKKQVKKEKKASRK